jgi:hypothetical protein
MCGSLPNLTIEGHGMLCREVLKTACGSIWQFPLCINPCLCSISGIIHLPR